MDTRELLQLMKSYPPAKKIFYGVFPCDELPENKVVQRPAYFIVNTHPSHMPGEHWLAICLNDDASGEFFDSYGNASNSEIFHNSIHSFLKKNCFEIKHSSKQVQRSDSAYCGQHCAFFLCHRARGYSFNQIMSMYTSDLKRNDDMVMSFVKNIYPRVNKKHFVSCVQCVNYCGK